MTTVDERRKLLILSDLHVGRDCKEITGFNQPRPNPEFDQAFIDLLDFYTEGEASEWRLLLGGDFIDFMEVVVVPEHVGTLRVSFDVTDEEREFGLGSEPERVAVKLERTMAYHTQFFSRLARFVREGGKLVMVRGNHDVELYWPKVQRNLRRALADLAFANEKLDVDDAIDQRSDFQSRIAFEPWFYYERGRIYFEHGHQYDPYCSFDHWLHPISPTNPRRIDTPISLFAMRYLVNLLQGFAAHDIDMWGWRDYVRWVRGLGIGGSWYTLKMGIGVVFRALEYAVRNALGRVRQYNKEHAKVLSEVAEQNGVEPRRLRIIDALHAAPVSRNLPELMRLLFLDRILLGLGTLFCAAMVLFIDNTWIELLGLIAVALAAWRVNKALAPRRYFMPGPRQATAAARIARLMKVPTVVMGHSHIRMRADLGKEKTYLNTGCWLPPLPGKSHDDVEAPCTCKLTHVAIEDQAAELRVFCKVAKTVRLSDVDATLNVHPPSLIEKAASGLVR